MTVALVSAVEFLAVDTDLPPLVEALGDCEVVAWDDPAVEWGRFAAAVVRSTWNYVERRDEFVAWAERVAMATRLANPAPVLRWNTSKRYLADLAAAGVPVVPTAWVGDGDAIPSDWHDIVVKPAVSAGSRWTGRFADAEEAAAYGRRLLDRGDDVLVQPYVDAVDRVGEVDVYFFGGRPSHAIRKGAVLVPGQPPVPDHSLAVGQRVEPLPLDQAPVDFALAALDAVPGEVLYARVDCVAGNGGELVLEVELVEPSLFLDTDAGAAGRFAAAVGEWLRRP